MADLFFAFGVICNSVAIILLQVQIRRLRRDRGLSVDDLKRANRIQDFIAGDSVNPFEEVSGFYSNVHLED